MTSKIKYYREVFTLRYYLLTMFMTLFAFTIIGAFYFNYSSQSFQGKLVYWAMPLFWIFMVYILVKNFSKKVALDSNGNISIPGKWIKDFKSNSYYGGYAGKVREIYYQFTKNNIKEIKLINYKDIKDATLLDKSYLLAKTDKVIYIKFKKALNFVKGLNDFGQMKPLPRIYISLKNPEKFISDLK